MMLLKMKKTIGSILAMWMFLRAMAVHQLLGEPAECGFNIKESHCAVLHGRLIFLNNIL
jgi:hypothetical protein